MQPLMLAKSIELNSFMNQQLALAIQLNDDATLTDFCWGNNIQLQQQLFHTLQGSEERFLYLWGPSASGKSHLLQACCHLARTGQPAIYLPLKTLKDWGPQTVEGTEQQTLITIDDVDVIAADSVWEEALFHLYNKIREQENTILIVTAQVPPGNLPMRLLDLRSRLSSGLVMQILELNDYDKIESLQQRAHKRGFELSSSVGEFLLNRCARNMHQLYEVFDKLDAASLAAQRKITIPFVKSILRL